MRVPSVTAGAAAVLAVIALAGTPARVATSPLDDLSSADPRDIVAVVDMAALPELTADDRVVDLMGADADLVAVCTELVRILEIESIAVTERNHEMLTVVNLGVRLDELGRRIDAAGDGAITTESYEFASMHLDVMRGEGQGNLSIAVIATGTLTEHLTHPDGSSTETTSTPFERTFAMRPGADGRWFLVAVSATES
jgi:hypothetical protein